MRIKLVLAAGLALLLTISATAQMELTNQGIDFTEVQDPYISGFGLAQILSGSNDAGDNQITNVSAPTSPSDVATKGYVDSASEPIDEGKAENNVDMNGYNITSSSGEFCLGNQC